MNSTQAPSQVVRPPEKGAFPLDHEGECKSFMQAFLTCMKEHKSHHIECKHLSKRYLECRMDKGLMQPEKLEHLGFHEKGMTKSRAHSATLEGKKEGEGFLAGLGVKGTRYDAERK